MPEPVAAQLIEPLPAGGLYACLGTVPGAFTYTKHPVTGDDAGITHSCPCGCGRLSFCHLQPGAGHDVWTISGPRDRPTLVPSVGIRWQTEDRPGYHWHGYLRQGMWVNA